MTADRAEKIILTLQNHYGKVKPGLDYDGMYQLTISVVLSAQTTDKQVNKITPVLFSKYSDFQNLQNAKTEDVEAIIKSTGFYHTKALNIIKLSSMICGSFNGKVPDTIEQLITLPGVGRKSANVILAQGHGIPGLAVDTHVKRISRRLGLTERENPDSIEADLKKLLPENIWSNSHLLMIHHGRTKCHARKPECISCPVLKECIFSDKNL